jgi:hypothetical protein
VKEIGFTLKNRYTRRSKICQKDNGARNMNAGAMR